MTKCLPHGCQFGISSLGLGEFEGGKSGESEKSESKVIVIRLRRSRFATTPLRLAFFFLRENKNFQEETEIKLGLVFSLLLFLSCSTYSLTTVGEKVKDGRQRQRREDQDETTTMKVRRHRATTTQGNGDVTNMTKVRNSIGGGGVRMLCKMRRTKLGLIWWNITNNLQGSRSLIFSELNLNSRSKNWIRVFLIWISNLDKLLSSLVDRRLLETLPRIPSYHGSIKYTQLLHLLISEVLRKCLHNFILFLYLVIFS